MAYTTDQINELERQLLVCLRDYEKGKPLISDDKYDAYKKILHQFKPDSVLFIKIGTTPKKNKSEIPFVLGSLKNKYAETKKDNIEDWLNENDSSSNGYVLSHKLDGLALEVCYVDSYFSQAWLRGDGFIGQDVTEKIKLIAPPKLNIGLDGLLYFKCEILLRCEPDFLGYANKRAGAAGIMNRDDNDLMRYLYILPHTWANPNTEQFTNSEYFRMDMLSKLFSYIVKWKFVNHKEEILTVAKQMIDENTQYDKDGIVVCINNSMVENVKHPEKKIAFKFNQLTGIATVKEIEWNMSRTRKDIPKIIIEPLNLGGVIIKHAAAFNAKYIYDNNIGPGAIVEILKAGDIIPYINKIISTDQSPEIITNCQECNSILISDDVHLICPNLKCPGAVIKQIAYFFEHLGLEEFGERMIESLGCTDIPSIFNLTKEDIILLEGWAETSAEDFIQRIQRIRVTTPLKLLVAFGIENVSSSTCKLLLNNFTFYELIESVYPNIEPNFIRKLVSLHGIGEKTATSIIKGLRSNIDLLTQLKDIITIHQDDNSNKILRGKTFCATGKSSIPRKSLQLFIEQNGGDWTSATSCQYLICNDISKGGEGKLGKNKGQIISEEVLYEMIGSRPK
jgi:DNA ligase (NAD+)